MDSMATDSSPHQIGVGAPQVGHTQVVVSASPPLQTSSLLEQNNGSSYNASVIY